jgi:hypothetical protein
VQCVDGTWSHAGGISGACADHGGEASQPLSSGGGETTAVPTTTVPSTSTTPAPASNSGSLRPCDQNISADAETSCGFASNTFYEYWKATDGDPETGQRSVDVWSPTTQQSYRQVCDDDGSEVSCTHLNGDEVQFSVASVRAYTQQEADAYAASASLGP